MKNPTDDPNDINERGISNIIDFPLLTELLNRTNFTELVVNGLPVENLERQRVMAEHNLEALKPKLIEIIEGCNRRENIRSRNFESRTQLPRRPEPYSANPYFQPPPTPQPAPQPMPMPLPQSELVTPSTSRHRASGKQPKRRAVSPFSLSETSESSSDSSSSEDERKRHRSRKDKKKASKKHRGKKSR